MKESQKAKILEHLTRYKHISPFEAMNLYGCMRLASRILELKNDGHEIKKTMLKNTASGKSHAVYALEE